MAVVYSDVVKILRMGVVLQQIDGEGAGAVLQIGTTGMAVILAEFTLDDPSGTVSGGVLTLSGFPKSDSSANATGTAAAARIRNANGTDVITGLTVGLSATDITLNSVSVTAGQPVTINSAAITHAA